MRVRLILALMLSLENASFAVAQSTSSVRAHAVHSVPAALTAAGVALPENIPDFSQDASRPLVVSVQSGSWSSPATWQGGQVPTANHIVRISAGHAVTIDDISAAANTVAVDGKLTFATTVNTRLSVTNLQVMAGDMGLGAPGILEVGSVANPVAAGVSAEIVIANTPPGGGVPDPDQWGTGLIVFGKVSMHGSVRTPTFVRLATEPRAGDTTLALSEPVAGWSVGDRIVLPDTRHIQQTEVTGSGWVNAVNQWEERTIQGIASDGRTVTLSAGLQYDHLGARNLNGVLEFLPHVGNLTRNVIVRSENATGTRGHMVAISKADVDIRYTLFRDLGRTTYLPLNATTNHIGRYPVHIHHLSGPQAMPSNGYQFTLVGNAVDGGSVETDFKWGVTVHGSHYGVVQDNVVYNYNGAAIATEDGSESFNVFDHNFVLRGMGEPNDSVSAARIAMGTEGVGFWFRGPNNYVRNNVAANFQNPETEAAYGFVFQFRFLGDIATPNFQGADTSDPAQATVKNGNNLPVLQFDNNEAYGAMQGGFTIWWVNSLDPQPYADAQETLITNLKLWNIYNKTVYMYPAQKVTFDRLTIRGSFGPASRCCGNGVFFADYSSKAIVIRNSDIQGMNAGITAPEAGFGPEANLTVENSYLRNDFNLDVPTVGSVNGCWMTDKLVVAINTRFDAPPGRPLNTITMDRDVASAPECLTKLDVMNVYGYNADAADNFQVFHPDSVVLPRPPAGCAPATRPGINGPTCPIPPLGPIAPTVTSFSASPSAIQKGQSATLTWNTANAASVTIDQGIGAVASSGTVSVSPAATTTYTLIATNDAGSASAIATVTVTTPPPITIANVATTNVTATTATITWTTDVAADSRVDYGTTIAYGATAVDAAMMTGHSEPLTALAPSTTYHYRVTSALATGESASSGDFVFITANPPDTTPPFVVSSAPPDGATGVSTATRINATFNEAIAPSTMTTSTFVLRSPANTVVPAVVTYDAASRVATLTPSQSLARSTTYTATISGGGGGVTDLAGNALARDYVWSFTTGAGMTIWSASAAPAAIATNDSSAVELGLKFRSDVAGSVIGVRFYKGATTTGTHTAALWSARGKKLASATFTGETGSGWQQVTLSTPVTITANTVYVVSYHTNVGNYAYTSAYFATSGVDALPLHALANGASGGDGVFRYGATAFPTSTFQSTNYWVDVVFVPR